jgi:hypothetical protein
LPWLFLLIYVSFRYEVLLKCDTMGNRGSCGLSYCFILPRAILSQ